MKFVNFPLPIAMSSELNTRASYEGRKGKPSEKYTIVGAAVFWTPEGVLRLAYDLYRPQFPEGCTPGLADVTLTKRYVNGQPEFVPSFSNAITAAEFMKNMDEWCDPQVARLQFGHVEAIVCTRTKAELAELIDSFNSDENDGVGYSTYKQSVHSTCKDAGPPKFRAYIDFPVIEEIFLADTESDVLDQVIDRMPFPDTFDKLALKNASVEAKRLAIEERSETANWTYRVMKAEKADVNVERIREMVAARSQITPKF